MHSIVAALPVVAALMMQYIVFQHTLPWGRATAISSGFAAVLAIGIVADFAPPARSSRAPLRHPGSSGAGGGCSTATGRSCSRCHTLRAPAVSGNQPRGQPISSACDSATAAGDRIWSRTSIAIRRLRVTNWDEFRRRASVGHSRRMAEKYRQVDDRPASHISGKFRAAGRGLLLGGGEEQQLAIGIWQVASAVVLVRPSANC